MTNPAGKVAVVTGGTFGVGHGIASVLAERGVRVFVTGRSAGDEDISANSHVTGIRCDHRVDAEVTGAFDRVANWPQGPWSPTGVG